ncbi:hypothetical protein [Formosa sp. PL04]|uniref:hypothetical protein n=1 Tax=Formosa sp. PL04 TaxID=3081755 RepID=UPI002981491D|nr:hypothetical protein [Formosa sp. PL04]MDW5288308.1 hypothetical protein [Formosa sp. PL04]
MKNLFIILVSIISIFSCKEEKSQNITTEFKTESIEIEDISPNTSKFEDVNGCSQYSNLYAALPHLDSYKNMSFLDLECMSEDQENNAFWASLNTSYYDSKSENKIEVNLYEIRGKISEARDVLSMAKTIYKDFTPLQNYYKSSLTFFDNASVNIMESKTEDEFSKATYLGTYKDKYVILMNIEMLGQLNIDKVDVFIKEYLQAIVLNKLQ